MEDLTDLKGYIDPEAEGSFRLCIDKRFFLRSEEEICSRSVTKILGTMFLNESLYQSSRKARGRPQRTYQLEHACVGSLVVKDHFPWSRTGLNFLGKSTNEFDLRRQAVAAAADSLGKSSEELVSEVSTEKHSKAIWECG